MPVRRGTEGDTVPGESRARDRVMVDDRAGRSQPRDIALVVDVANVMGSRPDGWWRDRRGAAARLLARLATLPGATVEHDREALRIVEVVAVVEGQARDVDVPAGPASALRVVRAQRDGDTALVDAVQSLVSGAIDVGRILVVTADRGLRGRLPAGCRVAGPSWVLVLLDAHAV